MISADVAPAWCHDLPAILDYSLNASFDIGVALLATKGAR